MENEKAITDFYNNIVWEKQYQNGEQIGICPMCKTAVVIDLYGKYQESSIIHCQTQACLKISTRGI